MVEIIANLRVHASRLTDSARFICSYGTFWLQQRAMKGGQMSLAVEDAGPLQFRNFEARSYARGFQVIAGIDEAGRGPLAGPVVAAAVILPRGFTHAEINDSKLLSAQQREKLAPVIRHESVCWGLGVVEVDEIDRINILQASLLAMVKALAALTSKPDCALIDGNQPIPGPLFRRGKFPGGQSLYQKTIVKGDQVCISIAAASILAKVARDRMMVELDKQYPQYGFASHKGYSCPAHFAALRRHGPSPIHRQSFKPVREAATVLDGRAGPLFES
jgi:ribonuclease HII